MNKKHIYYMDLLRVVACVFVVMVHVSAMEWSNVSVKTAAWQTMNAYDCIGIMGVPLFIMLSGALMLRADYEGSVKKILKKVLILFIVCHVWLLLYNVESFIENGYAWDFGNIKKYVVSQVIRGLGIYHLWFLPMLMVLYLLVPVLKPAFTNKKTCRYFLLLYAIFGLLIPTAFLFEFPGKYLLQDFYNRTSYPMLTGYIGYFVAGHYIHSFMEPLTDRRRRMTIAAVILCCMITITVCGYDALQKDAPSIILNNPLTITDFISTVGIYALFRNAGYRQEGKSSPKWLVVLSKLTFGIYLVHPFVLMAFAAAGFTTTLLPPVIMIPCVTLAAFLVSGMLSYVIGKIPFIGRYLV